MAEKMDCKKCKRNIVVSNNFYKSNSPFHPEGYVDICKRCVSEMVDVSDPASVQKVLQLLDKPFLYDVWDIAVKSDKDTFGAYLAHLNMRNHKNKTWKDSVLKNDVSVTLHKKDEENIIIQNTNTSDPDDDIVDKWGFGYTKEEYIAFEKKYKKLSRSYGEKTELHIESLKTYIIYKVKAEFATAKGEIKEAKEWATLAQKQAVDAKLNPNQMSKSDISGGVDVVSQLFEAVESELGIIPLLPRLLEQPYDDADMIIWSVINYQRKLEEKPRIKYRDIWNFYDEMLTEHFKQQNLSDDQIKEFKSRRNNTFRDMEEIFVEPLYLESSDEEVDVDG